MDLFLFSWILCFHLKPLSIPSGTCHMDQKCVQNWVPLNNTIIDFQWQNNLCSIRLDTSISLSMSRLKFLWNDKSSLSISMFRLKWPSYDLTTEIVILSAAYSARRHFLVWSIKYQIDIIDIFMFCMNHRVPLCNVTCLFYLGTKLEK